MLKITFFLSFTIFVQASMIIIIPSYNNQKWYKKNLDNLFKQTFRDWKAIYIDDCSSDCTYPEVPQYIKTREFDHKVEYIRNSTRKGMLHNIYRAIHSCPDDAIIVIYDGDDWFSDENALAIIAQAYKDPNVWITYGDYRPVVGTKSCCKEISPDVIANNSYRKRPCCASAPRTFYAWLFKRIKKEDLMFNGEFYPVAGDWAYMYPLLELAGGKFKFIKKVLYIYNNATGINDSHLKGSLQVSMGNHIRNKKPYERIII